MGLLDAVALLTRLPVPAGRGPDLARAAVWFPVVGAALGAVLLLLAHLVAGLPSPLVAVVLVVALEAVVTGALHLDGLADAADALGGRDRESRLRIMKDSATGVYGATALALALLLQVGLLVELVPATGALTAAHVGATAWALSRAAMLPVALALPYARPDGTGRAVVEGLTLRHTLLAWALPVLLCLLLGRTGVALLAAALLTSASVTRAARTLLGGATGDVLGATAQLGLLAALLALTLVP